MNNIFLILNNNYMYLFIIYVSTCACSHSKEHYRCQWTTCRNLFSHSTMWVLGIELLSGLVVSALIAKPSSRPTVYIFEFFSMYFIIYKAKANSCNIHLCLYGIFIYHSSSLCKILRGKILAHTMHTSIENMQLHV